MTPPDSTDGLSSRDELRVNEVQALAASGVAGVGPLVALLSEPSWVVRRAVIGALARIGAPALNALCEVLGAERTNERLLAATVDALVLSTGEAEPAILALAARDDRPAVLCDVAQVLGRRRHAPAVAQLSRWSTHVDDNVAVASLEALGRIGGAATIEPLLRAVDTRNFFRTFPAIAMLGQSGDPRALPPLVELLSEPHYATEAAHALGRSGLLSAVVPLSRLLADPRSDRVRAAARALVELRTRNAERFGDPTAVPVALGAAHVEGAAPRLEDALRGADADDTIALATVLAWLRVPSGVASLIQMLEGDALVADTAAVALRGLGHDVEPAIRAAIRAGSSTQRTRLLPLLAARRSAVTELLECLGDGDPGVRAQSCDALGRIGDPSAVGALFPLIGDSDAGVAQSASAAIQSLGSDETKRLAFAAARSLDPLIRRAALRILAYFGYPEALDVLLTAVRDDDERIRHTATMGLAHLEDARATSALVAASRHPSPATRAVTMRALGDAAATAEVVAELRRGLDDEDTWVRYFACQSLGKLHVTAAADRILAMIEEPAGQVRVAAIEALARLGGDRALVALEAASRSEDPDVRRAALNGLGRLRRPDGYALLLEAGASDDPDTRLAAVAAIAESPSSIADAALVRAAGDVDERVRRAAFDLLGTRAGAEPTRWLIGLLSSDADRERAMAALSHYVDGRIEGILSALETADERTSASLVEALLRMRRVNGNAAAESALHFDNVNARRAAATALANVENAAAREALAQAAAADTDPEVRRICAAAS